MAASGQPEGPVLIIEEDPVFRDTATLALRGGGFDVECAAQTDDGLGLVDRRSPALVMVGLNLPAGNLLLFEELRARHPDLRIMVAVGDATPDQVTRALWARVDDMLSLEVKPDKLLWRVEEVLARPPCLPGLEFISLVPHWIEVRFASDPVHFTQLRRFLEFLEDDLPGSERTGMIYSLSELTSLAMAGASGNEVNNWVRVACYRLNQVWGIRVRTHTGVAFTGPLDRLAERSPYAEPEETDGPSETWNLAALAGYADHLITSDGGNEAMLLRFLETGEEGAG